MIIEFSQQDLLFALKNALGVTWVEVAARTGIAPRTLKSYRLPDSSNGYRGMDRFVRSAVEKAYTQAQRQLKKV